MTERCEWVTDDQEYIDYHDKEWGRPLKDDLKLFELLCLEGQQAGLSWLTILKKRENFRKAFDGFDPEKIADYSADKIEELLQDKGIIRNRLKINSVIKNAKAYLSVQEREGSFSSYIWQFVEGHPIINEWEEHEDVPSETEISREMSRQMKKDGFKFVGPTICYAYMQSAGLVNDHETGCSCYKEIKDIIRKGGTR
ncbi:DNA-3-methyladenine glycosylase I [Alkalibacterium sp.]|nr:MAG: DNA-3-methyladenine glycosylase I [Alkalibacterium sp.]